MIICSSITCLNLSSSIFRRELNDGFGSIRIEKGESMNNKNILKNGIIVALFIFTCGCASSKSNMLSGAVRNSDFNTINNLINEGADVNYTTEVNGYTILLWCISGNSRDKKEITKLLLEKGANLEATNDYGMFPLMTALMFKEPDIAGMLVDKGSNVNRCNAKPILCPLMVSSGNNYIELTKSMINKGAYVDKLDANSQTALYYAINRGNIDIVTALITSGANVNIKNNHGITPLMAAAKYGDKSIVNYLLENGATLNAKTYQTGQTALSFALTYGHVNVAILLKEKGAE